MNTVLALPPSKPGLGLGTLRFQLGVDLGDACQNVGLFFLQFRVLALDARRVPVAADRLEDVLGPCALGRRHVDVVAGVAALGLGDLRRGRGIGPSTGPSTGRRPARSARDAGTERAEAGTDRADSWASRCSADRTLLLAEPGGWAALCASRASRVKKGGLSGPDTSKATASQDVSRGVGRRTPLGLDRAPSAGPRNLSSFLYCSRRAARPIVSSWYMVAYAMRRLVRLGSCLRCCPRLSSLAMDARALGQQRRVRWVQRQSMCAEP